MLIALRVSFIIGVRKEEAELLTARITWYKNLKFALIRGVFIQVFHAEPQFSICGLPLELGEALCFVSYDGKLLDGFASLRIERPNATIAVAGVEEEGRNPTTGKESGNFFIASSLLYEFIHSWLGKGE